MSSLFGSGQTGSAFSMILVWIVIIGIMYLIMFRPQQKKKKQEEEMKKNLKIGDEIVTIGGIVGKIISIKEDTDSIVIETGVDRSKMRLKKWAIASLETVNSEPKNQ